SRFADSLPDVVLNDLAGTPTPLSTWVGQPMLINFWATWCAPCLREIPLLKAFNDEHPSIQVVGIAVDRDEPVREFAAEMAFNYPNLVGQTEAMNAAAALGVEVIALPFTVFTDAEGAILGIHSGEIHREHLENLAATLADLEAGRIGRDTARERIAGLM
ncbi:MAG: TlpA disulfide reductase family protein, partial [Gammaproteobacteria bacterium]|nr:TlpA disulfide reductase family protein [Gammaproteobacteria bacterium]